MIITTSHATLIRGKIYEAPANTIVEILRRNKERFIFIRHSIDGMLPSIIYSYKNREIVSSKKIFILSKFSFLRYITEIISTFFYFLNKKYNEEIIYIGMDPLNAFTGLLLKKAGKFKKVIFYAADYSPRRFQNKILNGIYHGLDQYCVKRSDQIWNISYRIWQVREQMGIIGDRNIFVPNTPSDEYKKFLYNKKQLYCLVTLGIIDKQLDFINIFEALEDLKNIYPKILFKIIGNGPKEKEYKQYIKDNGLEKNVEFLGYLSHDRALEEISTSSIGLALYNGTWGFNYYGDSMKCREYFCFGVPVITTDTHSTVEEIKKYQAGIVCRMNKDEYKKAIEELIQKYEFYSNNAYQLAKKYQNIHKKLISSLLIIN